MKKIFTLFAFLLLFGEGYSKNNDDYTLFLNGKEAYYKRDFNLAKLNFETLLKSFSNSEIFSNNYPFFYIGMNYYQLGEYKKAAYFLEKAVYSSGNFLGEDSQVQDAHFFAERDFTLGYSLIKIGEEKRGVTYLKRVDYDNYYPFVAYYEKQALELLSKSSVEAENKLKLKFEYDFSVIDNFSIDELLKIGKYYNSKKEYQKEGELYNLLLSKTTLTLKERENILVAYFNSLIESGSSDKILELTSKQSSELKNLYTYYRGLAFYQFKDFSRALYLFSTIESGEYFSKANYYIASIYFALGDYSSSLEALKNIEEKNIVTDSMAALSYYSLKDRKNLERAIEVLGEKYPNTYVGLYFKHLDLDSPEISLNSLSNLISFSVEIFDSFQTLPENFLQMGDIIEVEQLSQISKLGDRDLLRIALEKSIFWKKTTPQSALAITTILENGKFYDIAFQNSMNNMGSFSKSRGLFMYNFPLYYGETINKFAKSYDVPQELIYAIIHNITGFNPYHISKDSRFGLMNIPYTEDDYDNFFELFDVDRNIEEGVKKLHELLVKYNDNKIKTLIAYVYGEEYLDKIFFDYTNDINLASILEPEERFFLQNLFMTYILYSNLYQFN